MVSDIDDALKSENPPVLPEIQKLYSEAGVVLPDVSLARYEDVHKFHEAIVKNRGAHISAERDDALARISERDQHRKALSTKRNSILSTLNSGGALSQYRKLDAELSKKRAEADALGHQLDLSEKFEALNADLKVERAQAERSLRNDLRERGGIVAEICETFEDISRKLYDDPASLDIVADRNGLDFVVQKPDIGSEGVSRAQLFTFDLTLATTCARRGKWPGFLIHDSHIFDGVDGRQIAAALATGHEHMKELGGQYIVTMNSDDLEKAERERDVSFAEFIIEPQIDDTDTGGLFGFRFATPRHKKKDEDAS